MRFLGLDLGGKRTGVAFGDDGPGFVVALDTIVTQNENELIEAVARIVKEKKIDVLAVGLPKLLDGTEGEQAGIARALAEKIKERVKLPLVLADERFSSYGAIDKNSADSKAACEIVEVVMRQGKIHY